MFIDLTKIEVKAGNGGNGIISFRREKFVDKGGPDGGNGGNGGNIYFIATKNLTTLSSFKYKRKFLAKNGENGKPKNCFGKTGSDIVIEVPVGTLLKDSITNEILFDIVDSETKVLVRKGGKGGRGNTCFKSSTRQTPMFSENGEVVKPIELTLELKLLADVGMVGFPNVGKSTILSVLTNAQPKISNYPFTTLEPNIGVVEVDRDNSFVLADLPGLIEGAHEGKGLGLRFLKHLERCKVLMHVIDISGNEGRDPLEDYEKINIELEKYNEKVKNKKTIVIFNKIDLENSFTNINRFKEKYNNIETLSISALTRQGLETLKKKMLELLGDLQDYEVSFVTPRVKVYELNEDKSIITVRKEENYFVVEGRRVEILYQKTNFNGFNALSYFINTLYKMGINEKLKQAGAKIGDTVKVFNLEFEYDE